jgi:hypothetical protein
MIPWPRQLDNGASDMIRRRIQAVSEPSCPPTMIPQQAEPDVAPRLAMLQQLNGTVLATISCHEDIGELVLGRGDDAGIRLSDNAVHRVHARIYWKADDNAHVIEDAGGANGTYVNRLRIQGPRMLLDGTRIRLGRTEMVYRRA